MTHYGYAGKILRVNLTTRGVSTMDVGPYKEYVGGMGIGYKIIWDEVPLETHPYAPESKAVISVGPLTATGVPCGGRTNISFLSNFTRGFSIVDAHIGGHWSQYMKYAGYDAIIIEGRSATPVYLKIDDTRVTFESATHLWGKGTFETNKLVLEECGPEFTSFAIGPAGENLVNYSIIHGSQGNSGGAGIGALFGSKNLKAITCRGTGAVPIANPKGLMDLTDYMLKELLGGCNNHIAPGRPQSWAEFTNPSVMSMWNGAPGRTWGASPSGPVDMGEQHPGDMNRIGFRSKMNHWPAHPAGLSALGFGDGAEQYLVKEGGCSFCPISCYSRYEFDPLKAVNETPKHTNTCLGITFAGFAFYPAPFTNEAVIPGSTAAENGMMISALASKWADDLGIWENYMALPFEWMYCMDNGFFEPVSRGGVIPDAEWNEIRWDLRNNFDPEWIPYIFKRIANREGEISHIGDGTYHIAKRWNFPDTFFDGFGIPGRMTNNQVSRNGYTQHHPTDGYQASMLHQALYNRDNMTHCITNFLNGGLPFNVLREIVEGFFGEGALDPPPAIGRTPINASKINLARWTFLHKQWHDMSTLCDWVWPMTLSPLKERGYKGDLDLEGKFMTVVTGDRWDTEKVHYYCEKVSAMLRVMTIISFNIHEGHTNLREGHDRLPEHWFTRNNIDPFVQNGQPHANNRLDRADWARSQDMFYESMGWDKATGIPTRATLVRLGLPDMADALAARGLLPS